LEGCDRRYLGQVSAEIEPGIFRIRSSKTTSTAKIDGIFINFHLFCFKLKRLSVTRIKLSGNGMSLHDNNSLETK
jgi:hypothetical protein